MHPRAATYPVALDHAFLQRWAPVLPHFPRPRISSPYRGVLRRCHVSHGPRPHLPAEVGSSAASCLTAPHLASLSR
jgi:hypothetical protein